MALFMLCFAVVTGRGIGAESYGMDSAFPSDDLGFALVTIPELLDHT